MVELRQRAAKPQALVIGGAGFVGRHIVQHLLRQGHFQVAVFDLRQPGEAEAVFIQGDLTKQDQVDAACAGKAVVFHAATAAVAVHNARSEAIMTAVNVDGTRHVIQACQRQRVPKLVYISSASVVWEGRDLLDVDETAPYALSYQDFYGKTKVLGEKLVLAANGQQGVATCALRPSTVFGEYDTLFLPSIVAKAKEGKMKYYFGTAIQDWTYAGNIAHACVLAEKALGPGGPAGGQVYFITNGTPSSFWGFVGDMLEPLGYGRPRIALPAALIYSIAWVWENIMMVLLSPFVKLQASDFSTSRIKIVTTSRRFNLGKARQQLGYEPVVSLKEAQQRTLKHFTHLQKP